MTKTTNNTPETDIINPNLIQLETYPNIRSVRNRDPVQDIRACDTGKELRAYTNGGHQDYNYTATMIMLSFKVFTIKSTLKKYSHFPQWRASSVS